MNKQKYCRPYKNCPRPYQRAISPAKKTLLAGLFSKYLKSTSDSARFSIIMTKERKNPSVLKTKDNFWAKSSNETLKLLVQVHFSSIWYDCRVEPYVKGIWYIWCCGWIYGVVDDSYLAKSIGKVMVTRIQRIACVGTKDTTGTFQTDALNVFLQLLLLDFHIKYSISCSAVKL